LELVKDKLGIELVSRYVGLTTAGTLRSVPIEGTAAAGGELVEPENSLFTVLVKE